MNNRLMARIARRGGGKLLDFAVARLFPEEPAAREDKQRARRSVTGAITGAALTRVATRSIPGAIVITGGLLAKTLYDRRKARNAPPAQQAESGTEGQEPDESDDGGA